MLCIICKGIIFSPLVSIGRFRAVTCKNCGLISLLPKSHSSNNKDYPSVLEVTSYVDYMKPLRTKQYTQELVRIKNHTDGKRVLDIGCAMGWFLKEASSAGYDTWGLEPQKELAVVARNDNPQSKIIIGDLDNIKSVKHKFDVITLWSVIEHFTDPLYSLKVIGKYIGKNGVLAIRTPNSLGLVERLCVFLYKLSNSRVKMPIEALFQIPFDSKHWYLFTPNNLSTLLESLGFKVVDAYFSTSIDWQNIDLWLKSRKITKNSIFIRFMKLFFLFNKIIGERFRLADDFVIIAKKNGK